MINVTKKNFANNSNDLIDEKFLINADNINFIEDYINPENWEKSMITMNNKEIVYTSETKEELKKIINNSSFIQKFLL